MANPQAEVNYQKFITFVRERESEGDWEDYRSRDNHSLNKQAIAKECGFDRKRINENSKIIEKFDEVVTDLLKKGILTKDSRTGTDKVSEKSAAISNSVDKKTLKFAQECNAALEQELSETKIQLQKTEEKLKHLEVIESYMMETGRL
ncbi:hypothetical protein C1S86_22975 [Vibrio parahaemolyticus]|uniref:Uncharacterized protein n=1 Tax=Vibrio aestuarianus TaxID=28171 RepID=A0A9X4IR65_9VIBR|nr:MULTISPECIES: hypothetical protein [Vibrio]MDE1243761.1 hypothetical protein [Vibrio aestuarianus]OOQ68021.1 hypothetical protein BSR61_21225 [Vibrio parahaemolyticus]PMT74114.1 hypothetical protein C1S97_23855 [Vibrio parahaemolyticus]PMT79312.1 hypothetical protein C1S86_22975 [Vibrio parahaemolyticus]HCG6120486.1 hypothetical protein [Vibrio parahaemolyticus]